MRYPTQSLKGYRQGPNSYSEPGGLLGGPWVLRSRVISRVAMVRTPFWSTYNPTCRYP